jgi:hypothetical protein
MAKNDPNDFWGKGTPSQPPSDPNEGFWSAKKPEAPKPDPAPDPKPDSKPQTVSSFLTKGGEPEPEARPDGAFWNKAQEQKKEDAREAALPEEEKQRARKRRKRKILLICAGSVLLLIVLLVAMAPTMAGWMAPGIIASKAGEQISGKVAVESTSFGWFGPQHIKVARLLDKDGKEIARASVDAETGLFGLIHGNLDIGTVTLSGVKADIVRYPDGTTNLEKALGPKQATPAPHGAPASSSSHAGSAKPAPSAAPAPSKGTSAAATIPDSLNAHLTARNIEVTFIDQTKAGNPTVTLKGADLDVKVAAGEPLSVLFSGDAVCDNKTGKLSATIKADKLIRKDGVIQPDKAAIDADIALKGVPLQLADAFAPLGEGASFQKGLGDTLDVTLKANGTLKEAKATLAAAAANLSANADLRVAGGVLTTQSPIDVNVKGAAVRGLVPAIDKSLAQAKDTATVTAFPDAHLTVQNLKLPIPSGGADLDLRGAAATVELALTETAGTVMLPATAAGGKAEADPFRVAPLSVRIEATDLGKDAHVTAATTATINNQPAGNVNVDLTLAGLLDAKGAPVKGPPGSIQGTLAIKQIATAIAQPLVASMNIDLPRDVGPTLDIEARASTGVAAAPPTASGSADGRKTADAVGGGTSTDINLSVQSQGVKVAGALKLSDAGIVTAGEGLRVDVLTAGQMASRFVGPQTGWRIVPGQSPGGGVALTVKNLNVPMDAKGAIQLDKAAGVVSVVLGAMKVQPLAAGPAGSPGTPNGAPIDLASLTLGVQLAEGAAKLDVNSALAYSGTNFGMQGSFNVPGLIVPGGAGKPAGVAPVEQLRPVGKLEIKDVPTMLVRAFTAAPSAPPSAAAAPAGGQRPKGAADGGGTTTAPLDLAKLLSDTLGPSVAVAISTAPAQGTADAINAGVTVKTATTTAEVSADVGKTQLALKKLSAQANVTPQTVSGLMSAFAPNVAGVPRLAGPASVVVQADPMTIPLKDYKPQLDRAGQASVKLSLPGKTVVDGLVATNADGTKRDLGRVGVDSLEVVAKVPVGALVGPVLPEERRAVVTLGGTVLGNDNAPIMELSGRVQADISDSKLMGALAASAKVDKINTKSIEHLAGQEGLLTGALGDTASVELAANITPPAAAAGQNPDMSQATGDASVTLAAPHLHTEGPIKAVLEAGAVRIDKPVKLTLDADPSFVNKLLEPKPDPGAKGEKPVAAVRFTDPAVVTVTISDLVYPRPGAAAPAPLSAALAVAIPTLKMVSSDNQAIRLSQVSVQVKAQPAKGAGTDSTVPVTFQLNVAEAAIGEQPSAKALALSGSITDLLDTKAEVSTKFATVNATGDLPAVPTALVDALAKQNGLLVEALGPVASVTVNIERYPLGEIKAGGTPPVIEAHANAQRANAELRGTIQNGVFVSETPVKITVVELTQALAKRFVKGLPVVGSVEKTKQDAPGVVTGSALTVPLGDDMSKLNGDVAIDPGEARFGTSGAFAGILKTIKQRDTGTVGHRLEPLNLTIRKGVVTYAKWKVPLGEFDVETEGTIDLVKRQIDVVTWLPFGALTDQAAGSFNTGLGSLVGKAAPPLIDAVTMVPFSTKGPLDNPTTKPDLELFAKNFVKQLSPDQIIKHGLGDLFKKGGK